MDRGAGEAFVADGCATGVAIDRVLCSACFDACGQAIETTIRSGSSGLAGPAAAPPKANTTTTREARPRRRVIEGSIRAARRLRSSEAGAPWATRYLLALCTLTNEGFRMPGRVMRCRIVGRDSLAMGGSEIGLPDPADLYRA